MTRLPVVDLCTDRTDEGTPSERHPKRLRKDSDKAEQIGGMCHGEVVDVTEDSPQEAGPSSRQEDLAEGGSRSWWGELDEPPRWRHGRRRTVLRTAPTELPIPLDSPTPPRPMPWLAPPHQAMGSSRPSSRFPERQVPGQHSTRSTGAGSRRVPPVRHSCMPPVAFSEEDGRERMPRAADLLLARRLQEHEDAEAARRAQEAARAMEEEDMVRRMDELEAMEAMEDTWGSPAEHSYASWSQGQGRQPGTNGPPRARYGQRRGGGWGAASLAEAMMGMLSEAGPLSHMQLGGLQHHMAAVRQALTNPGRLPAHLLFSDRDFDENDYEALLALDDTVKSRKGATTEAIEKIPTVVVPSAGVKADEDCKCPICLEELSPGAVLRRLPCKHHFHQACVDTWLLSKSVCPICLQPPCDK